MIVVRGGRSLFGRVRAAGAKNAALPAIFASLLTSEPVELLHVPCLRDVETAVELVEALGKEVLWEGGRLVIREAGPLSPRAPEGLVRRMRASFLVLGPLVARLGEAQVPLPGGCAIGTRPVDLHLKGLSALGAELTVRGGWVHARAPRLQGRTVYLDYPSVGATEQLLLAGALADRETVVLNPAREPEVVDLSRLLSAMGAETHWEEDRVTVKGGRELSGASWEVIPDRIEAGTFLLAGAITGGKVRVEGVIPEHLGALLVKLGEAGVGVELGGDWVEVAAKGGLRGVNLETRPYPGFPTDLQPPMVSLLSLARGESLVTETVFEGRFGHVGELLRMGASIRRQGASLLIRGVEGLTGTRTLASDIRAGAALVLAGLVAQGTTYVEGTEHIHRGYENLTEKLRELGAWIWEEGRESSR
ncbi:MAG: UDP-N-acetylglucosamine 1-carboxyvinyltransferase [Acetothermia bacterium 64_32]|nr:MAG: UDP-N-acetylglucosamine 1-carboxyvinyltransferase [Acetothermia bacterium 64_32]HAF70003.1 UDP-N-acetylglucosamine 1-carboxyvinyltransferase [Candidatus Acetothermia bacterium]